MAIFCGCDGRLTSLFGDFRPGAVSGNGIMEPVVADILAQIHDPLCFVIDCVPNMNHESVAGAPSNHLLPAFLSTLNSLPRSTEHTVLAHSFLSSLRRLSAGWFWFLCAEKAPNLLRVLRAAHPAVPIVLCASSNHLRWTYTLLIQIRHSAVLAKHRWLLWHCAGEDRVYTHVHSGLVPDVAAQQQVGV